MDKFERPIKVDDLPIIEHEGTLEKKIPVIHSKHASKHMSFNTQNYLAKEVVEREDGVGYDPKTGTFYQTNNFK